jgi:DNA-binding response OmpR family regulator
MNKRSLIIEDEKDIVEALRYNLEKEKGFSVLSATSGDEGLNLAFQVKPNLIILDIGLPGLNGYEVCRMLRRDVETRDIPILMVTARVSESDKVLGLELGADDYITKPFDWDELRARVRIGSRIVGLQQALGVRVNELQQALGSVRMLSGLLPICAYCKRIRDDQDYWKQIEHYLSEHSNARFSHGICPDCMRQHLPEES